MVVAGAVTASMTYIMVAAVFPLYRNDIGFYVVGPKFLAIFIVATISYVGSCLLLDLKEAHTFLRKLKQLILKPLNLT